MSHNCGLAKKTAMAIQEAYPGEYETWFFFPSDKPHGLGWESYRALINDTVKGMVPEDQVDRHNWHSAPCCWIEFPDRTVKLKGGGDRFREWALETFPECEKNKKIRTLAGREPKLFTDLFFDYVDPGTTIMHREVVMNELSK